MFEISRSYRDERRRISFYEGKLGREMESLERVSAEELERNNNGEYKSEEDVVHDLSSIGRHNT